MYRRILLVILFYASVGHTMAQQSARVASASITSSDTPTGRIYYGRGDEPARAIEFKERSVTTSYFLANINNYFDIPEDFTFIETESNTDDLGMRHRLLEQYYKGIPVEGMGYRVHERDGFVTSANGKGVSRLDVDTQVVLTEEEAFYKAVQYLESRDTTIRKGKKLIVSKDFTLAPESFSVAFQFDIDVSLIERWRISIDARNGLLINKVSLVNTCHEEPVQPLPYGTGVGTTSYYGNQTIKVETFSNGSSRLVGQTANGGMIGTYDFANVSIISLVLFFEFSKAYDIYSSNNTYYRAYHKPAVSVQWAAEQAYEYYFKRHGRNSFDDKGAAIKSYVHVDKGLKNAFWTGKVLAFGDGTNNDPLVELDVVAHELTHGVTQYEARLQYANEPGALNESFSDILGKAVEFETFGDTATWQMGRHAYEGGLRDLSNPNLKNQPDTYLGDMWHTGYEDSGGVHYNSGVQNFWFYLLCEGGNGVNDRETNYSVQPIGMQAATNIAYRNLTEYLTSSSDYLDSRIGSLLAAADLHGKNSTVYQEVANAWDAVGVIDEPIITSLELYDITATTVKIKGDLLPRGDTVTYHFEYGTTPDFGTSSPVYKYSGTVEGIIRGLQSETQYYLRLVATNENGSSYATTTAFTTISLAPLAKIKHTVDITERSAALHGEINPNSLTTSFYFEYGLTPDLELVTPTYSLSDTTEFLDVSAMAVDLQPRQTYYYRLIANNSFASSATESLSLFTAAKPEINSYTPATAPIGTEVVITGKNFNPVAEKNVVTFGATHATVLSSTTTEIKVKVPAGASLAPISLLDTESGLTAESVREFVPTFTEEFKKNNLHLRVGVKDIAIYQPLVQDMDGDNRPDIVGGYNQGFMIYQNVSQGGDITIESFIRNIYPSEVSGELYAVDFDGNGLKDVVGRFPQGIRIYPNFSVPGFIFFGVPLDLPMEYPGNFSFNDFDQDGHIDIAVTRYAQGDSSKVTIIRNQNPKGVLSSENFEFEHTVGVPYYVFDLSVDDLNNDGRPDLIFATADKSYIPILKNNSQPGIFAFEEVRVADLTRSRFANYVSNDLNQDGWKDLVSHSRYDDVNMAVLKNAGTSDAISLEAPVVALTGYLETRVIKPGDIDGDGRVDLLVGNNNGKFLFLKNQSTVGGQLSASSFEIFETFEFPGMTKSYQSGITISDLNGDGRPEVINTNSYNQFPYDGYQMEIWQNAAPDCVDPSSVRLDVSANTATIILPDNTAFTDFQFAYRQAGVNYWHEVTSTTLQLWSGYSYQLRARAKCYLGFTAYHYIDFTTDCVNTNSFTISNVTATSASLNATSYFNFEVQYSPADQNQWTTLPQNTQQISNLLPGTRYDVRYRGRCSNPSSFKYKQFVTLCPVLSSLTVSDISFNRAMVKHMSNYTGKVILEYSTDNLTWTLIDETGAMLHLAPAQEYVVRGRLACTVINSDFVYTSFTTPCAEVSTLTVDAITPFSATISWIDESGADIYFLTYSSQGSIPRTIETSSTSLTLDNLSPGTRYSVAVAPQCHLIKKFTSVTFNTVCYVPFDLSVQALTETTAELTWNDHFNALPYTVTYGIAGSNLWQTTETELKNLSLAQLRPGTEYEVRVNIKCLSQTPPFVSVQFETGLYAELTFAPNPTDDNITIYPSRNLIGSRFSIQDNAGRVMSDGALLHYTIDLSGFSAGVYLLKIEGVRPMRIFRK